MNSERPPLIGKPRTPRPARVTLHRRRGRWCLDVFVPRPDGGRQRIKSKFATKLDAEAEYGAIVERLRRGLPPYKTPEELAAENPPPPRTVADVLAHYAEKHVPRVASAAGRLAQHSAKIAERALGQLAAEQIALADLEGFRDERTAPPPKGKRRVSAKTVAKDLRHLKAAMRFAKRKGLITRHVFESLDRDDLRELMPSWKSEDTAGRVITDRELASILLKLRPAARRAVRFLRATGLRKMEACALDWREHWRDLPYPHFAPITQKGSKPRKIPFDAVESIVGPRQRSGLVFSELGSTAREVYDQLTACWRYATKRAGIRARLHDLRHTFGSTLRRSLSKEDVATTMGISAQVASTYLDHEAADLTLRAFSKLRAAPGESVPNLSRQASPTAGRGDAR
jgi:integrase